MHPNRTPQQLRNFKTLKIIIKKMVTLILSPTYFYADFRKQGSRTKGSEAIGDLIRRYNTRYIIMSVILAVGAQAIHRNGFYSGEHSTAYAIFTGIIIWIFPLSRANEVFYAFLRDATDKVDHLKPASNLKFGERINLALKSYTELILDFAIIYYLLPQDWFSKPFSSLWDAMYFSGVTITTLGYGDYSPTQWIVKFLSIYEVLCGFILIIVSFAIYTGRGLGDSPVETTTTDKTV